MKLILIFLAFLCVANVSSNDDLRDMDKKVKLMYENPFSVRMSCHDSIIFNNYRISCNTSMDIRTISKYNQLKNRSLKRYSTSYMLINRIGESTATGVGLTDNSYCIPLVEYCILVFDENNQEQITVLYYDKNDIIIEKRITSSSIYSLIPGCNISKQFEHRKRLMFDVICIEYKEGVEKVLFHWNNFWRFGKENEDRHYYRRDAIPISSFLHQLHKDSVFTNKFGVRDFEYEN